MSFTRWCSIVRSARCSCGGWRTRGLAQVAVEPAGSYARVLSESPGLAQLAFGIVAGARRPAHHGNAALAARRSGGGRRDRSVGGRPALAVRDGDCRRARQRFWSFRPGSGGRPGHRSGKGARISGRPCGAGAPALGFAGTALCVGNEVLLQGILKTPRWQAPRRRRFARGARERGPPVQTEHTPVLVVGGGLVGLSAALFLAWRGVPTVLVERHPGSSPHPRAIGFTTRTLELSARSGSARAFRNSRSATVGRGGSRSRAWRANGPTEVAWTPQGSGARRRRAPAMRDAPKSSYSPCTGRGDRAGSARADPSRQGDRARRRRPAQDRARVFEQDEGGVVASLRPAMRSEYTCARTT